VANFVGTYWPVGDDAAETFGTTFYRGIAAGQALGAAIQAARSAVHQKTEVDWADYIHYGDFQFLMKAAPS
jgi:hypothetical protein